MTVAVSIATTKDRKESLRKTLDSLIPDDQINFIYVQADYPQEEKRDKVVWSLMSNKMGDARKFYPYCIKSEKHDIWLFCDDDIIYPKHYGVGCVLHAVNSDAVFSYHGRTIKKRPIESYYRKSRIEGFRCLAEVKDFHQVAPNGTLGTGVMFFKTGVLKLTWDMFKSRNMADIWITKFAIEQGKEMIVVPHGADKFGHTENKKNIFEWHQWNDGEQTKLYNSIK